jgi:membrane associated rhomboid family serine protease
MIPFATTAPCHRSPVVAMSLIVLNIAVFFYQEGLGERAEYAFVTTFALIPAVYGNPAAARDAGLDPANLLPLISNTFLHGGYLHLIVNMWTLWLFGLPVEDRLGPARFAALYLGCGAAGSLAHLAFNLSSQVPALGASGAIAGVLGAFVWIYPRAKVAAVVPIIIIPWIFHLPAILYAGVWFLIQIVEGWGSLGADPMSGGIAWWAHIGGFAAGLALAIGFHARPSAVRGPWQR